MTSCKKIDVYELDGKLLNHYVAKAEGLKLDNESGPNDKHAVRICEGDGEWSILYTPAYDWDDGGPIIDRMGISLSGPDSRVHRNGGPNAGWGASGHWSATIWRKGEHRRPCCWHETSALIAAMRTYVAWKFGPEVDYVEL